MEALRDEGLWENQKKERQNCRRAAMAGEESLEHRKT